MKHLSILDRGSLVGFYPHSDEAKQWIADNVASESWQWMGSVLWVDHRPAQDLINALQQEGLLQ